MCNVSVIVGVDAELDERSVSDTLRQTEDAIVSQWREVSADEKRQMREQVDEILRPLGFRTRLLVIEHDNSLALFFLCMSFSAIMSLRDHWYTGQLGDIVQSLFTLLSGTTPQVCVKRITWPLADYVRCLEFSRSEQSTGKQTI